METFKYNTRILKNGIIEIPEISKYAHRPVEVFIVLKEPDKLPVSKSSQSIDHFFEKWTGFMSNSDPDKSKLEYLEEKYS